MDGEETSDFRVYFLLRAFHVDNFGNGSSLCLGLAFGQGGIPTSRPGILLSSYTDTNSRNVILDLY